MQRIFALDAFRALAIMLVFMGHTVNSFGSPAYLYPLQFGGTGVDLFFVLSGWLIGNQLFLEKQRYGDIQIKRFWVRRWMRTLPAYYAVLSVTILQQYLTKDGFDFPWAHLFFLQNYQNDLELFYISWSLSVEEQFYLLIAPFIVFALKLSRTYQITLLISLLLLPTVFRELSLYDSFNETHVRLDCCAMGVLLAYIKHNRVNMWRSLLSASKRLFPLALFTYFFFFVAWYNPEWNVFDPSKLFLAILFGIWIVWSDQTKYDTQGKAQKVVMHISTRSYAMYLLHVDALIITKKLIGGNQPFALYFLIAFVITLVLSEVLYRMVEIPIMKARKFFSISKSRSEVDRLRTKATGTVS